jgi:hypothetical protein
MEPASKSGLLLKEEFKTSKIMKNKTIPSLSYELSDADVDEILEKSNCLESLKGKSNWDWIRSLESRLVSQRKDFLALLDRAAENPSLLPMCAELRQEIQQTKARLADLRFMRQILNYDPSSIAFSASQCVIFPLSTLSSQSRCQDSHPRQRLFFR